MALCIYKKNYICDCNINFYKIFAMKKLKFCFIAFMALMFTGCAKYTTEGALMGLAGNTINTYVAADLDYENARRVENFSSLPNSIFLLDFTYFIIVILCLYLYSFKL